MLLGPVGCRFHLNFCFFLDREIIYYLLTHEMKVEDSELLMIFLCETCAKVLVTAQKQPGVECINIELDEC